MTQTPFTIPPGLISDDTDFAAPGSWRDGSLVRFYNDQWEVKGGWERFVLTNLGGVCRSVFPWQGTTGKLNVGFGVHNALKIWQGGLLSDITPVAFVAGQIDGTGGSGYGTGPFGQNTAYGVESTGDFYPLTWSLAAYGGNLVANPRGQTIFMWEQVIGTPARVLAGGCPAKVTYALVVPQRQVMALGCNQEIGGVYNPLAIRWSDIENPDVWSSLPSNNAGEFVLEGGGRIVCGRVCGEYVFVWTTTALFLGTFVGDPSETWKFERIGSHCGAISPGAPVVKEQSAAWISPDRQFWQVSLGGAPSQIVCPIRASFSDHVSQGQDDKIVGGTTSTFQEVTWFWPRDTDGLECSRSLTLSPGGWSNDQLARTAYCDAGPQQLPIGVTPTGESYFHEAGQSADSLPLAGFIESGAFYLSEAEGGVLVNGMWPDFKSQVGTFQLTIFGRQYPQGPERTYGPWLLSPGQLRRSFRVATRIARVRFDFNSTPCFARGGRLEFDVNPIGGR